MGAGRLWPQAHCPLVRAWTQECSSPSSHFHTESTSSIKLLPFLPEKLVLSSLPCKIRVTRGAGEPMGTWGQS